MSDEQCSDSDDSRHEMQTDSPPRGEHARAADDEGSLHTNGRCPLNLLDDVHDVFEKHGRRQIRGARAFGPEEIDYFRHFPATSLRTLCTHLKLSAREIVTAANGKTHLKWKKADRLLAALQTYYLETSAAVARLPLPSAKAQAQWSKELHGSRNKRKRKQTMEPGNAAITDILPFHIILTKSNDDVKESAFDVVGRYLASQPWVVSYMVVQERGGKKEQRHLHALITARAHADKDSTNYMKRDIYRQLHGTTKACGHKCNILYVDEANTTQSYAALMGYLQKDSAKSHYRIATSANITADMLKRARDSYRNSQRVARADKLTMLEATNATSKVLMWYKDKLSPLAIQVPRSECRRACNAQFLKLPHLRRARGKVIQIALRLGIFTPAPSLLMRKFGKGQVVYEQALMMHRLQHCKNDISIRDVLTMFFSDFQRDEAVKDAKSFTREQNPAEYGRYVWLRDGLEDMGAAEIVKFAETIRKSPRARNRERKRRKTYLQAFQILVMCGGNFRPTNYVQCPSRVRKLLLHTGFKDRNAEMHSLTCRDDETLEHEDAADYASDALSHYEESDDEDSNDDDENPGPSTIYVSPSVMQRRHEVSSFAYTGRDSASLNESGGSQGGHIQTAVLANGNTFSLDRRRVGGEERDVEDAMRDHDMVRRAYSIGPRRCDAPFTFMESFYESLHARSFGRYGSGRRPPPHFPISQAFIPLSPAVNAYRPRLRSRYWL